MTGHLIHIGYPKTGSNFLRHWFAAHPQLAFADGGFAGFRDVYDFARQAGAPVEGRLYRVTSAEGLATPHADVGRDKVDYARMRSLAMPAAQERVCAELAALYPDAWILIVTRGFRMMILSAYSQYVRTGGTDPLDSFCAPSAEGDPARDAWDYDRLIALYRKAFPGRVIVLPYELLRDNPSRFTGEIEARLGLATEPPSPGRWNPSLSPVELAWYPLLTRAVGRLPLGRRLRAAIERRYLHRVAANRLARPIALLQRLHPLPPVTDAGLAEGALAAVRGRSETLRDDPLYAPYADEYLFIPAGSPRAGCERVGTDFPQ